MESHWKYIEYNLNDSSKLILYNIAERYGPEYALQALSENVQNIPPAPPVFSIFNSKSFFDLNYGTINIDYAQPFNNNIPLTENMFCLSFKITWPFETFPFGLFIMTLIKDENNRIVISSNKLDYYINGNYYSAANLLFFPSNNTNTKMQYNFFYNGNDFYYETYDFSTNSFNPFLNITVPLRNSNNSIAFGINYYEEMNTLIIEKGESNYVSSSFSNYVESFE